MNMEDNLLIRQIRMIMGVTSDLMKEVDNMRKRIDKLERGNSRGDNDSGKCKIVDMTFRK